MNFSAAQVTGGIAYAATLILFVSATKLTTAGNAILLQYTAPLYVALLSGWLLKEKTSWFDWVAIARETAWLFTKVGVDDYTATDIQRAIWAVMGMNPTPYNSDLVTLAHAHSNFNAAGFVLFQSPREGDTYGYGYQDYISRVPEPAAMLLLGLGLVGLTGVRRKLKK